GRGPGPPPPPLYPAPFPSRPLRQPPRFAVEDAMTDDPLPPDDVLTDDQHEQIDRLCEEFEADWRAGRRHDLAARLRGVEEPLRSVLLCELLVIELRQRRRPQRDDQERTTLDEYIRRFPEHAELIAERFREERPNLFPTPRLLLSAPRTVFLFAVLIDFRRGVR